MLSAAAVLLAFAAVAWCSCRRRLVGLACVPVVIAGLIIEQGLVPGLVSTAVLLMTATSVLVLLLPAEPARARLLARVCTVAGLGCVLGALLR